jgi:Protein of unknown function (DUF669)
VIIIPKLTSATAAKVEEAESADFEALPEGMYNAVLEGEVEAAEGPKGPYWKWTFKLTDDGYVGRKLFHRTSLNESAMWKLKETFEAFGVSADTDTDDLIGQPVKLMVVQEVIGSGSRKGDMGNTISRVLPASESAADPAAKKKPAKKGAAADDTLLY